MEFTMLDLPANFAETAGYRTHYVKSGSEKPFVLIHGGELAASGLGNWQICIPQYAQQFQVCVYAMVGSGKSEQAIALIEALGVWLVGWGRNFKGAVVASSVAIRRPDLLNWIVLMSGTGLNRRCRPRSSVEDCDFNREGMHKVIRSLSVPD